MAGKRDKKSRARCFGKRADGRPCALAPLPGTTRCWHHTYKVPGRPGKLTSDLTEQIVDAVRRGAYFEVACQAVGIDKTTMYRWLRRGEEAVAIALEHVTDVDDLGENGLYDHVDPAEWPYIDFRHALESASAIGELELLEHVWTGAPGWQAHMTILERRHPSRWGRRMEVKHDGAVDLGKPKHVTPDDDRRQAILNVLGRALDPPANDSEEE